MKTSELIKRLTDIMAEHGDLIVEYADGMSPDSKHGNADIKFVDAYDKHGCTEKKRKYICII